MQNFLKGFLAPCFLILLITGCDQDSAKPVTSPRELARSDIDFMTKTLLENHPGPKNSQNPEFMDSLNTANREAITHSAKISSVNEHIVLLKKYVGHFNDEHLKISIKPQYVNVIKQPLQTGDFSLREFMPHITWVTLPTFEPRDQEQVEKLHNIITQIHKFRSNDLIIFDVRGNGGGNSAWGIEIIMALFGKEYSEKKFATLEHNVYVEWRASNGNIEHINAAIDKYKKQFGKQSEEATWAFKVYKGMIYALKNGIPFYAEHDDTSEQCTTKHSPSTKTCTAKIIVLIDKCCFSACLNFLDQLKSLDHPLLFVGQTTSADTLYMDVRSVELPSKIGQFQFPMKVYRNRRRKGNQPHHPDITYHGNIKDTQAMEEWLKQNIIDQFLGKELKGIYNGNFQKNS